MNSNARNQSPRKSKTSREGKFPRTNRGNKRRRARVSRREAKVNQPNNTQASGNTDYSPSVGSAHNSKGLNLVATQTMEAESVKEESKSKQIDELLSELNPGYTCLLYTSDAADD